MNIELAIKGWIAIGFWLVILVGADMIGYHLTHMSRDTVFVDCEPQPPGG
jgi:hypothetical protein